MCEKHIETSRSRSQCGCVGADRDRVPWFGPLPSLSIDLERE